MLVYIVLCVLCCQCILEERDPSDYTTLSDGVIVGAAYRVVACDCAVRCDTVLDMCGYCTCKCKVCGGSPHRRPMNTEDFRYDEDGEDDDDSDSDNAAQSTVMRVFTSVQHNFSFVSCVTAIVLLRYMVDKPYLTTLYGPVVCFLLLLGVGW